MKISRSADESPIERVRAFLAKHNMADRVREFEVSSATVELAALALDVKPARIAKTLAFEIDNKPILIFTAGDAKIDNKKFKQTFRQKAKMVPASEA